MGSRRRAGSSPTTGPGRHTLGAHHDISLPGQGTKAFLVLRLMHIKDDAAFIQVGVHEGKAQLLCTHRQQGSHLPARITPAGSILMTSAPRSPRMRLTGSKWFGDIQHANPVEPHRAPHARRLPWFLLKARGYTLAMNPDLRLFPASSRRQLCRVRIVAYRGLLVICACGAQRGHV